MNKCISIISKKAKEDIENIVLYIYSLSNNKELITQLVLEIKEQIKRLEEFPNIGKGPSDTTLINLGYRFIVYKDYLIFYSFDEIKRIITIKRVINSKTDYNRKIKSML